MAETILTGPPAPPAPAAPITLEEFLVDVPLFQARVVTKPFTLDSSPKLNWPLDVWAHCETCDGKRRFHAGSTDYHLLYHLAQYVCTDCRKSVRDYFVEAHTGSAPQKVASLKKVFQFPAFGDPIPKRLFEIIGEENRQHYLNARRSMARGLGIGAYTYYRRIVEEQKFYLVSAIRDVAKKVGAGATQLALLDKASEERQFSKAVGMLTDVGAIPAVLLIEGRNPLLLLHDELSEGVHAMTDAECLERAQHAEVILHELARLMQIAVTERRHVESAVKSILNRKKPESTAT